MIQLLLYPASAENSPTAMSSSRNHGSSGRASNSRQSGKKKKKSDPSQLNTAAPSTHLDGPRRRLPEAGIIHMGRDNQYHTPPRFDRGRHSPYHGDLSLPNSSQVVEQGLAIYTDSSHGHHSSSSGRERRIESAGSSGSSGGGLRAGRSLEGRSMHSTSSGGHYQQRDRRPRHPSEHAETSEAQRAENMRTDALRRLALQNAHRNEPAESEFWDPRSQGTRPGKNRGKNRGKKSRKKNKKGEDKCVVF